MEYPTTILYLKMINLTVSVRTVKAKIEAENVCIEFRKKGMCVPILRPKSFIGPERLGVFALFLRLGKGWKKFSYDWKW